MNDDKFPRDRQTITVNEIARYLSPLEWVYFRRWAGLDRVERDSPILIQQIEGFKDDLSLSVRELYYWWQNGESATNFTARLYDLIGKADAENRYKLGLGFPLETLAWQLWHSSPNETRFFESYGIGINDWKRNNSPKLKAEGSS